MTDPSRHLDAGTLESLLADTDPYLATQAMHALMVGIMHEWVLEPAAYDLAAAAPALIDMLLAGLKANPPRLAAAHAPAAVTAAE